MSSEGKLIVVGGDGLIGSALALKAAESFEHVIVTSRRNRCIGSSYIYFDLQRVNYDCMPIADANVVVICAAMTSMQACESDPRGSRQINVVAAVSLALELLKRNIFVVFLSSNAVFDGSIPNVDENYAPYRPLSEYGRQKAEAEQQLISLPNADRLLAIVRLSKVLSPFTGIAADFLQRLRVGHICETFDDLKLCPASIDYICDGLTRVATAKIPGIFHLSGAEEMSYTLLAHLFASAIGADEYLVIPTTSNAKEIEVVFRPAHPALGMSRTKKLLNIYPEPTSLMLSRLVEPYERV